MEVFVSVGTSLNPTQEAFVAAVETRLWAEGFTPRTVGRNTFGADAPLRTITKLMDRCQGTVVIALERYFFPQGVERRGSKNERGIEDVSLPTSWNQIEAAMAYCRGHPLLVLVDANVRADGLLEHGNDWFVQRLDTMPGALSSTEFNGVFADWRDRVRARATDGRRKQSPAEISIFELLRAMRAGHAWMLVGAIAIIIAVSVVLGVKLPR